MKKWTPRNFNIPIWQYSNKSISSKFIDHKFNCPTSPVKSKSSGKTEGLQFTWEYIIEADGDKLIHYRSEEQYLFSDKNVSVEEMLQVLKESYDKSNDSFKERISSAVSTGLKITSMPLPTVNPNLLISLLNK